MNSSIRTNSSSSSTRLCFIEEDDGLASIAQSQAQFPTNNNNKPLIHRPLYYNGFQKRSSSLRNLASLMANPRFFHEDHLQHPTAHFLDSCFLCKKTLCDRDIFMYRGNIPFCSEECRQEQIEMDEATEKSWNSTKALRKNEQTSSSPNKTNQNYRFRTSTVAAA